jgi:hypothetical protein
LYLLRRTTWYRTFFTVASIGLAIVALGWMIERLFEKDLRISSAVDPIVSFPRSILWAVLFTAAAGAVNLRERRRGSLRATVDLSSVGDDAELVLSGSSGAPR